jgi:hypothetical protein
VLKVGEALDLMDLSQFLSFSSNQEEFGMYPKVQQPKVPTSVSYVIQSGKMPNAFVPQHNYEPSHGAMKIKEEPESPTTRNLPATPKSNDPPSNQQSEASDSNEQQEEEGEEDETKKFVLAPTPAQLGKAPLQRRLNRGEFVDLLKLLHDLTDELPPPPANSSSSSSMPDTPTMETITTSVANTILNPVPSALPTPTSANFDDFHSQMSPSVKSKLFKKAKMDEMDK